MAAPSSKSTDNIQGQQDLEISPAGQTNMKHKKIYNFGPASQDFKVAR